MSANLNTEPQPMAGASWRAAWKLRGTVVPVFLGTRLLVTAIIAPLTGLAALAAVELSGQAALTDQDILAFLLSPLGFAAALAASSIWLAGSVVGTAVMTLEIRDEGPPGLRGLPRALGRILARLPKLLGFAAAFVLRVAFLTAPFGIVAWTVAGRFLSAHDINYYLDARPPEFVLSLVVGAALAAVLAVVLLQRLLTWALSLHMVLLEGAGPRAAFANSRSRMAGRRLGLLRRLLAWLGVRAALSIAAATSAGLLAGWAPRFFADDAGATLWTLMAVFAAWAAADMLIAAFSLGALAILLNRAYDASDPSPQPPSSLGHAGKAGAALLLGGVAAIAVGLGSAYALVLEVEAPDRNVQVIAHRGAAGARPENTLAAFQLAVEDGAHWVELDVQENAEGVVVVAHDSDFMKVAGDPLKVWDSTAEDLASIDIGSWFDPAYAGERTPTLAQSLEVVRGTESRLLIELKHYGHAVRLEERVVETVEAAGMADRVAVMSLKYPSVQALKALRPDWRAGVLAAAAVGDLTRLEGDFLAVNAAQASRRLVRAADAAGKDVYVWTVNDPLRMTAMISLGVDGLITDEPALAREVIETRADLGAPARLLLLLSQRLGLELSDEEGGDGSP